MAYQWSPQLSVGVTEIDVQHQELFNRFNHLLDAMRSGKGKLEVAKTIQFLGDYVQVHFADEEQLMQKHSFTGYASHKLMHTAFIRTYLELKRQVELEGSSPSLTLQLQRQLGDWLIQHIGKVDQVFGAYLRAKTSAG